jgi:uncharacterized protein with ACT and thioredoxin-like domain
LVAAHAGGENRFTDGVAGGPIATADESGAVFQHEYGERCTHDDIPSVGPAGVAESALVAVLVLVLVLVLVAVAVLMPVVGGIKRSTASTKDCASAGSGRRT